MKLKLILYGLLFVTMQGCSQKVKETYKIQETMSIQNPEINANNIVEKLVAEVQHYPKEPFYLLSYTNSLCFFEVLVNDIPVKKEFEDFSSGSAFRINHAIFKNGTQKVTYRLYASDSEKGFNKDATLELTLELYDNKIPHDEGIIIKEYTPPLIPNPDKEAYQKKIFAGTGREYYEGSFTFETEVSYQLEGFEKAKDLRKMDKQELETRLLKKYQEVWSIYQNKDYDNIARLSYDNLRDQFISKYSDQKYIQDVWDMLMGAYKLNSFHMQPIENYDMKFFADGKLVALMTKSQEPWARGNTALWGEFDRGEGEEFVFCNRYFYILEGENDFRVY